VLNLKNKTKTMKKELMTMEEKKKLDPKELMENGLTREENEKLEQGGGMVSLLAGIFSLVMGIYVLSMVL